MRTAKIRQTHVQKQKGTREKDEHIKGKLIKDRKNEPVSLKKEKKGLKVVVSGKKKTFNLKPSRRRKKRNKTDTPGEGRKVSRLRNKNSCPIEKREGFGERRGKTVQKVKTSKPKGGKGGGVPEKERRKKTRSLNHKKPIPAGKRKQKLHEKKVKKT